MATINSPGHTDRIPDDQSGDAIKMARNPLVTLIALTRKLVDVIRSENALLRERRPAEARPLIEEKSRLASAYAREMAVIRKNGGVRAFGNAEQLRELKRETTEFQNLLDEHRRILERARAVTEGMLKAVGTEVARRQQPPQGYGKNAGPAKIKSSIPTSLTLNQII